MKWRRAASGPRTVQQVRIMLKTFREKMKPIWVHLIDARTLDTYRQRRLKDKGNHGGPISPHTVRKELRHIHAAPGSGEKRWNYLREVPDLPKVAADEAEKVSRYRRALLDDAGSLPRRQQARSRPSRVFAR